MGWGGGPGGALTPPAASRTTRTKELSFGSDGEEHLLYSVPRLVPSCSTLYVNAHVSCSCSLGGTSSRISSASARDRIVAEGDVLACTPDSVSGVSGGGWKGDAVRWGGV